MEGGVDAILSTMCRIGFTTIMEARVRNNNNHTVSIALVRDCPIALSVLSGDPAMGPRSSRKDACSKHETPRAMHST